MIHGSPWSLPQEVHRLLNDNGRFLYVAFRQRHFMRPLLNQDRLWDLDMQVLSGKGSFDYYGYLLRKAAVGKLNGDNPAAIPS
ncbi:hypothetical protein VTI74DRAFT_7644 [Chaetomium olivicolor]